ncbi:MAG TPA: hypothetical protein VNJ46_05845 [Gaiellaceae bacterium]|nr:hypothetical protein [Gaiellaceae bacterium]
MLAELPPEERAEVGLRELLRGGGVGCVVVRVVRPRRRAGAARAGGDGSDGERRKRRGEAEEGEDTLRHWDPFRSG